jgi:hypothetical protein
MAMALDDLRLPAADATNRLKEKRALITGGT